MDDTRDEVDEILAGNATDGYTATVTISIAA